MPLWQQHRHRQQRFMDMVVTMTAATAFPVELTAFGICGLPLRGHCWYQHRSPPAATGTAAVTHRCSRVAAVARTLRARVVPCKRYIVPYSRRGAISCWELRGWSGRVVRRVVSRLRLNLISVCDVTTCTCMCVRVVGRRSSEHGHTATTRHVASSVGAVDAVYGIV